MTSAAAADRAHDPFLPNVLIIGDSISIGYTEPVRQRLDGIANVYRIPDNAQFTGYGLDNLDDWLAGRKWDVIHFNFGLHDLFRPHMMWGVLRWPRRTDLRTYAENLRAIVQRLKETEAKLIFATTTPVPAGAKGRDEGSEVAYNLIAKGVMAELGVAVNDLHALASRNPGWQLPRNVHYTDAGYDGLGEQVAAAILTHLPANETDQAALAP